MIVENQSVGDVIEAYLRRFYKDADSMETERGVYARVIREAEKRLLSVTLDVTNGNKVKASRILGINRNTFLKKLRDLGLEEKPAPRRKAKKRTI